MAAKACVWADLPRPLPQQMETGAAQLCEVTEKNQKRMARDAPVMLDVHLNHATHGERECLVS